jgi:hypothetical protein
MSCHVGSGKYVVIRSVPSLQGIYCSNDGLLSYEGEAPPLLSAPSHQTGSPKLLSSGEAHSESDYKNF